MRTLIHIVAATTILTLPVCRALAADTATFPIAGEQSAATASPNTPTPSDTLDQKAGAAPQTTTKTPSTTTAESATPAQPAAAAPRSQPTSTDETAAQPAEDGQSDQAQQNEADNTQSSGPLTATDKIVDHFMALDTDQSDSVSFDEYMAMVQQRAQDRFNAMDTNGDGQVTAEEYRKFWKERKAQWYRLRR